MKPSLKAKFDFALAAVQGISAQPTSGNENADAVAIDAWTIAEQMMANMPWHLREALSHADELWESTHG